MVLFLFQRVGSLEERFIGVPLEYEVDEGFVVTNVSAESVRIDIRGSGDEIFLVFGDDIRAYLDLTSFTSEGIFKSPVLLEKTASAQTVEVEMIVEPLEVTVTLEQKIERELEIAPNLRGYPSVGYELVRYLVTPETAVVSGPRSSIEGLERLTTVEVDLSGRKTDFTVSVPVQTEDDLIVFAGSSSVEIRGIIREVIVEKTFNTVPIDYLNLASRFELEENALFGSLTLSGPQLAVESIRAADLRLVVDCGTIADPGVFELPVSSNIPPEIAVLTIQPSAIECLVTEMVAEDIDQPVSTETPENADTKAAEIGSEVLSPPDLLLGESNQ